MNTTRLMMDARALVWPWCAVMAAGLLVWLPDPDFLGLSLWNAALLGFWFGVPLLATLVLGQEFQYGTWPLLLSQPVDRRKIWAEKSTVIGITAISVVLLYAVLLPSPMLSGDRVVIGVLWAIISTSTAVFWTLTARSTIGGFVLIHFQLILIVVPLMLTTRGSHFLLATLAMTAAGGIGIAVTIGYAALMLWLGRRKLLAFQVTGSVAPGELIKLDAGRRTRVRRVLLCSPSTPRLNLIRKEIHLLWPLWLSTGLILGFVVFMTPFSRMPGAHWNWTTEFALGVVALYSLLGGLLAGSLSIGEEKASGTLSFHRTLPVPMLAQWRIKLLTGLSSSLICTVLVYGVTRFLLGQRFNREADLILGPDILLGVAGITFAAFWCAAAVRGTIPAILWSIPATALIFLALILGNYASLEILGNSRVLGWAITKVHPFPFPDATGYFLQEVAETRLVTAIPLAVLLLVAGIQSYRLFRADSNDRAVPLVRHLSVLALIAFVGGFSQQLPYAIALRTYQDTLAVLEEAAQAASSSEFNLNRLGQTDITLSVEDLGRDKQLSALTRSWLTHSSVHLAPRDFTSTHFIGGRYVADKYHSVMSVNLEGGWSCDLAIPKQGWLLHFCQSPSGTTGIGIHLKLFSER